LTESRGDVYFDEGREVTLKGLDRPHHVFAVRWR
jgi:hypothetical protein